MEKTATRVHLCDMCGKPGIIVLEGTKEIFLAPFTLIIFGIHPEELKASWAGEHYPFTWRAFHFCRQDSVAGVMAEVIAKALRRSVAVDEPHYCQGQGHWITAISKRESGDVVLFNIQFSKTDFLTALHSLSEIPFFRGRI